MRARSLLTLRILSLVLLGTISLHVSEAFGDDTRPDPYKSLMQSESYAKGTGLKKGKKENITFLGFPIAPYLTPGTNFYLIFDNLKQAEDKILSWIAPYGLDYSKVISSSKAEISHIDINARYTERATGADFYLTILVPHPAFYPLVDTGMIEEFANFQNPKKVTGTAKAEIGGLQGVVFYKDESCSVVFNTPQKLLINVTATDACVNMASVKKFIRLLNFKRLEHELQSSISAE